MNKNNVSSPNYEYFEKIYSNINKIIEAIRKIKSISDYEIKEYSENINMIDLSKSSGSKEDK